MRFFAAAQTGLGLGVSWGIAVYFSEAFIHRLGWLLVGLGWVVLGRWVWSQFH